jgi:VCBS repeat protein/centrosomal CEP192-like protein/FG-GAP repeat protein
MSLAVPRRGYWCDNARAEGESAVVTYLKSLRMTARIVLCAAISAATAFAQFETRAGVPVSRLAQSLAVGDFNRDGKLDLAVASEGATGVSVLLGNGDGTFRAAVNYSVPVAPDRVAVADLRNIGIQDLVVTNFNDSVSVLLGNGDGTFQPAVNYPTPPAPTYVAVGDFNGDHILDIVTLEVTGYCHCISVLLGKGDGTFQEPAITANLADPASAIGVGDFNGDGKLDIAAAWFFGTGSGVDILLGNGDGTFRLDGTYPDPDVGVFPVTVADLRGNGKLDLAIPGGNEGVGVLLGNGDGTFGPVKFYGTLVAFADSVAVGDVNGDGKPDLVVGAGCIGPFICYKGLSPVEVLLGSGDGTFQPPATYPAGTENGEVALGDFNGDKLLDVAIVGSISSTYEYNDVFTLLNTGVVSFSPSTPFFFPAQVVGTTSTPLSTTLTNTGSTTLTISSIRINGPYQLDSSTTCGSSVAPGGNCTLAAVFSPTLQGSKTGLIAISDSASTKLQIIELQGVGTVVSVSPAQLSFPPQKVGTKSTPQTVTVTNTSSTAVTFSGAVITGPAPKSYSETNTCGSLIAPGASCTVSVTFAPTTTGTRSAVLNLKDSGGGSPQTVSLSGTGT